MSRPFKLNDDRIERVTEALAAGVRVEVAARYGGLNQTTVNRYLVRARKVIEEDRKPKGVQEKMCVKLLNAIEEAEIEAEVRLAANISLAADKGDWRAAAWILPRRYPERWADKTKLELSGKDGEAIKLDAAASVLDALAQFAKDETGV